MEKQNTASTSNINTNYNHSYNNNSYNTNNNYYDNKTIVVLNPFTQTDRIMRCELDKLIGWIHNDERIYKMDVNKWISPLKMIENTHMNPNNTNIRAFNKTSNIVQIYNDNNEWENIHVEDLLRDALESVALDLQSIIREKKLYRSFYSVETLIKALSQDKSGEYINKNKAKFIEIIRNMSLIIEEKIIHV